MNDWTVFLRKIILVQGREYFRTWEPDIISGDLNWAQMVYFLDTIACGPSKFSYPKTKKIEFSEKLNNYEYFYGKK